MENLEDKTLDELLDDRCRLQDIIYCHEMGDDMYYTSPLYRKHQSKLWALNKEIDRLTGKAPIRSTL